MADLSFPTSKTRRGRVQGDGNICPTLMANNQDLYKLEADEVKKYRIRKLTPKECWRLMGFKDEDYEKAAEVNSPTQLYAQAGNSIVKLVLEAIFMQMIDPVAAEEKHGEMMGKLKEMPMQEPIEEYDEDYDLDYAYDDAGELEEEGTQVAEPEKIDIEKAEPAAGMNLHLPIRPGDVVYVPFRGIVLKCEITYCVIYRSTWVFEVVAYDQGQLRRETADLIYLWNHQGRNFQEHDIGVRVFTDEKEALKAVAG